jgi:hypothetical protein
MPVPGQENEIMVWILLTDLIRHNILSVQSEDLCRGLYVFSELRREVIVRFVDGYWWN